jgi:excisionase family DNA binding protein
MTDQRTKPDKAPSTDKHLADQVEAPASYLTAEQVANLLQASPKTVYRIAKADSTMPMLKLGGLVRFPRARLDRWLRDREQGRPPMRRQVRSIAESRSSAARSGPCADPCAEQGPE